VATDRLAELARLYETTISSIDEVGADKRSPLIREARALLSEIESLGGASVSKVEEGNGLVDFQKRLAERQPAAHNKGRAAR